MSLTVNKGGGDFELVPEGVHVARCFKIIDLGTQDVTFAGEAKQQDKVEIYWELLDDNGKMSDGKPFVVRQQYTASLNDRSRLYADLVSWRGKSFTEEELEGFKLKNILGAYCQVQIIHNKPGDKVYANIQTITPTKEKPKAVNENILFDFDEPSEEVFNDLSNYLQDKIKLSPQFVEWQKDAKSAGTDKKTQAAAAPSKPAKEAAEPEIEEVKDDVPF